MDLLVKQEIPSIIVYQRIALDLAAGPLNAGRVLVIQLFSETVKEHLVKKTLRDKSERISESELVPLADHPIFATSSDLSETNPRD